MKFELNEYHRNTPDDELLEDLKRVAKIINKDTVTIDEYNEYGSYHATTLTRRFKSWFNCLQMANLKMSRSQLNINNHLLFEDIERVWMLLGKQPTYTRMSELSKYSIGTYEKRFGTWRKSLEAFVQYVNSEEDDINMEVNDDSHEKHLIHTTTRNINLRLRFLVMKRDNFKCCICGAAPAKDSSVELHIDHIVPWSKGGETTIENLQTLCSKCNLGKGDLSIN